MNKRTINTGLKALAKVDDDLAKAFMQIGPPEPRLRAEGFEALFSIIISQQLSTESAAAIKRRVTELMPEMSPEQLLKLDDQALRGAGLSRRKVEYARGVAEAIINGQLDIANLDKLSDNDAISTIAALRGFGRWSAEIYLMFSLRRRDIFPADDLALQVALGRLKGLKEKPTPAVARELVQHWAPWRSVGSLFLWHYYRGAPN